MSKQRSSKSLDKAMREPHDYELVQSLLRSGMARNAAQAVGMAKYFAEQAKKPRVSASTTAVSGTDQPRPPFAR